MKTDILSDWSPVPTTTGTTRPITTSQVINMVLCGGLFSVAQQWAPFESALRDLGRHQGRCLHNDYTDHGLTASEQSRGHIFDSWGLAKKIESMCCENMVVICHSAGIQAAVDLADMCPDRVTGIIAINPAAWCTWRLPLGTLAKFARPRYGKAMLTGKTVRLASSDAHMLADGSHAPLGVESGKVLRRFASPWWRVKPLSQLHCHSAIINSSDDLVVPRKIADETAIYHGCPQHVIHEGGHFPFYHEKTAYVLAHRVSMIIDSWQHH